MKKGQEKAWQRDPNMLETDPVQLWGNMGILLTGCCPLVVAKECVVDDLAFVISDQAIGYYE